MCHLLRLRVLQTCVWRTATAPTDRPAAAHTMRQLHREHTPRCAAPLSAPDCCCSGAQRLDVYVCCQVPTCVYRCASRRIYTAMSDKCWRYRIWAIFSIFGGLFAAKSTAARPDRSLNGVYTCCVCVCETFSMRVPIFEEKHVQIWCAYWHVVRRSGVAANCIIVCVHVPIIVNNSDIMPGGN